MVYNTSNNRQLAKNTAFLYFRMILTMCIGLYTSRVVLNTLGVVDFGIFSVVGGLVAMFDFINGSMQSGSLRFITFAIGKSEPEEARRAFTSSVVIHFGVAILIIILAETIGLWFLSNKMVIPEDRVTAAFWIYQLSLVSACIMIVSVPYNVMIIAQERMSAFAYLSILEVVLKLLIVYVLYVLEYDKLIVYGLLYVLVQLLVRFTYTVYCKRHFGELVAIQRPVDWSLAKEMVGFSSWSLNGALALMASTQGINLLLNMFFGPVVNAARGIAVQVQGKVVSFCNNFQLAVNPQITKAYAQSDFRKMHGLVIFSSKVSFFLMLVLSLPVAVCIHPILKLWLGTVPEYTDVFVVIMLLSSLIRAVANPLLTSVHATGRLKRFQLIEGSVLLAVFPVSYFLLRFYHITPVQVMLVYLTGEIVAQCARIAIVLPMIGMSVLSYCRGVVLRLCSVLILSTSFPLILSLYLRTDNNFLNMLFLIPLSILSAVLAFYYLGCGLQERFIIAKYFRTGLAKILKR